MNQEEAQVTTEDVGKVEEVLEDKTKCQCPEFTMEEWIRQEDPLKDDPDHCRPCRLGVTANWYFNELQEQGLKDLAENLEQIATNENDPEMPLTLCGEFDRIKDAVEEPLRERLKDFDCATQSFNPDDVDEESTAAASKSHEEGTEI